ncbi:sterol desaturase family protein [Mangrovimonas sp. YM274]|uniref:sterol desaturase family protein n=1 Tax=Mangrovimonas sp. YM274 TaxID=3070660 RepID=UPI0027DCFF09|nr:sterol desaturase family protein [Mangrovimonas sp. YM274]WMI67320.1 sterol desaturase family protein [Mangrovimonas sp. YM274]
MFYGFSHTEIWIIGTILFILRYVLIAGVFFYLFYVLKKTRFSKFKIQKQFPLKTQIKREQFYSLLTFLIYGCSLWLFVFWVEKGYTQSYSDLKEFGLVYFVVSILIMVFIHDTYFYWTHRLIHHSKFFKHIHKVHHGFTSPTPWAAFAFHPWEAIISLGFIPIILFVIPHHQWALVVFITFLTLYNVVIHLGYSIPKLKQFKILNTPDAHDFHHLKSKMNYGLYFTFWDRLMGTYYEG